MAKKRIYTRRKHRDSLNCWACGRWMTPIRGDAHLCSPACRQEVSRKRRAGLWPYQALKPFTRDYDWEFIRVQTIKWFGGSDDPD